MIQTENTHLSKPAFIKVVCPTSNYRIAGQPAGQTQQGPLGGCSCPETHWSLYLVTQVSTHRNTHTLLHKPQTLICTVLNSLPVYTQHLNKHNTNAHKPNNTYTWLSIVLTVCLPNRLKNNPKVEHQGESVPQSDSRGRQTGSGEIFSITSYYSHRQSGPLRCFKRWPWGACVTT